MSYIGEFFHYGTIAAAVAINAISVGIGQGITSSAAIRGINQQPAARNEIINAAALGMALIETGAIIGLVIAFILVLGTPLKAQAFHTALAKIGILFAICLPGIVLGFVSAFPAKAACLSIARQPFFSQKIVRLMLLTLSLIQTPIIFGFIIAIFIQGQAATATTMRESLRLIASGLSIGLGSVGPIIGLALYAKSACQSLGINRKAYNKILSFSFISQAIIETPIIFALVISIILLLVIKSGEPENLVKGVIYIAGGLAAGLGTIGAGISSGRTSATACKQIAYTPEYSGYLSRASMFAQGIIETCAIYAIVIAFWLLLLGF